MAIIWRHAHKWPIKLHVRLEDVAVVQFGVVRERISLVEISPEVASIFEAPLIYELAQALPYQELRKYEHFRYVFPLFRCGD